MKAPKVGVKITIRPLSKAALAKTMASPSAKTGEAFRKTLPGKKR